MKIIVTDFMKRIRVFKIVNDMLISLILGWPLSVIFLLAFQNGWLPSYFGVPYQATIYELKTVHILVAVFVWFILFVNSMLTGKYVIVANQ